ncbi:hypothetical protein AVEN_77865-1 [Araneus ventricosus]|uniref:Uncharacterized protein n=1 Tax=Araneus ventricosus TaxID=182803 RepID=A0A4Y2R087_ARAVE|nr:hypothetical protein AVEN_77865-1 [Araneus ventricosus]
MIEINFQCPSSQTFDSDGFGPSDELQHIFLGEHEIELEFRLDAYPIWLHILYESSPVIPGFASCQPSCFPFLAVISRLFVMGSS